MDKIYVEEDVNKIIKVDSHITNVLANYKSFLNTSDIYKMFTNNQNKYKPFLNALDDYKPLENKLDKYKPILNALDNCKSTMNDFVKYKTIESFIDNMESPMIKGLQNYTKKVENLSIELNKQYLENVKELKYKISWTDLCRKIVENSSNKLSVFSKNFLDIDYNELTNGLTKNLNIIEQAFEKFEDENLLKPSNQCVSLLKKNYWVIPYEYDEKNLNSLLNYRTKEEFESFILNYFDNDRIKRIFQNIKEKCEAKDKKELLNQIEKSYYNGDYAICITALVTLLDGLTLCLINENSDSQQSSYKVIGVILKYMDENSPKEYSRKLCQKVKILNNFYGKLYKNKSLKTSRSKELSRHLNSHGAKYLNSQIDVLRLLNAIHYCQEIIEETNMYEQFTKKNPENTFKKIK